MEKTKSPLNVFWYERDLKNKPVKVNSSKLPREVEKVFLFTDKPLKIKTNDIS